MSQATPPTDSEPPDSEETSGVRDSPLLNSAIERDVLIVLCGLDDPNGLDVKAELDEYYDKTIRSGHLYPTLNRLNKEGLVSKESVNAVENAYNITARGRRELKAHLRWQRARAP